MMATRADSRSIVEACVLLTLLVVTHAAPAEFCDKTKCPGPLRYYHGLGCTPVYKKPGDCCAERFNCSHLKDLSEDKCYVNGHEYNIDDDLRKEDANACDLNCKCEWSYFGTTVEFSCAEFDCAVARLGPNCYYRYSHDRCCPGPQICLKEGEEQLTCEVDGQVYRDGEYFNPESDPEMDCHCLPGYKGENVEPFCKKPNRDYCTPLFNNFEDVYKNCAPVFSSSEVPQTGCGFTSRCQNANDTVIHNHDSTKSPLKTDEDHMCRFGNMTMHIGDELNQGTFYDSVCVKCVCEVPPLPTCQRLAESECDVTKHDPFPDDGLPHFF